MKTLVNTRLGFRIKIMAKKTMWVCTSCGYSSTKSLGKCPECGLWGTFEEAEEKPISSITRAALTFEEISEDDRPRFKTNMEEFDRVLGGGIVQGSVVLIGGEPGVGKSTLMLAVAQAYSKAGLKTLYCSGEESPAQLSMRARRIGTLGKNILLAFETDLDLILDEASDQIPKAIFIDSVQTVNPKIDGVPGGPNSLRETARKLVEFAKSKDCTVLLIGHVTKDGSIAGPKTLEHLVDVVCYLEGERYSTLRILHGVKNRFGSTDEVGLLEMTEGGFRTADRMSLIKDKNLPGVAVTAVSKGNRPIAIEVQALVAPTYYPSPRRVVTGCSINRTLMILAVLEKRIGLQIGKMDVYTNLVGGIDTEEPSLDLAIAMSVASSFLDKSVPAGLSFIGEIGLTGEIRSINQIGAKLKELQALGVKTVIVPKQDYPQMEDMDIITVESLEDTVRLVWPYRGSQAEKK